MPCGGDGGWSHFGTAAIAFEISCQTSLKKAPCGAQYYYLTSGTVFIGYCSRCIRSSLAGTCERHLLAVLGAQEAQALGWPELDFALLALQTQITEKYTAPHFHLSLAISRLSTQKNVRRVAQAGQA